MSPTPSQIFKGGHEGHEGFYNLIVLNFVLFVTQRYQKIETNMFVVDSKDQAAIFSVWNVASISR